ncbi:HlyD family secretion protein [Iningainema tapete]|uniref:HlyD family efflux transporter periplasmic adaptor subunit n=1 Tax=Iningainema tapete BLCC-T55 TaxID=2748662 RepID=A0A8J6XR86_9CYAN|nr:HlyD family efflux transporter periplasmic adaptor subunit [Iningainema tapete]MBD2778092.1 HlyD family efflux transporter periplasmic adaptor subunit [Iningainema tapete BLCC-T55]
MVSDSQESFLPPAKSEEFLPSISSWTTIGGLFLVGTVCVAFTVAAITKYNVTVRAPATVRPVGELRVVQAAVEGKILRIEVKENQVVKQGEAIALIDDSRQQTLKSQLQSKLELSRQQLGQIDAQLKSLESQRESETDLIKRTIASAQADLSGNQRSYQQQQVVTQTEVTEAAAALELARVQLQQYQQLNNTGAIAQLQIKEKEQAFKAAQAKLERAKAALNPSAASVKIAIERIAQEKARGETTLARLNKQRDELIQRRVEINNQLSRDQKELQQINSELNKSVIKAPVTGTLLTLNLRNPSQIVRAGETIAQIAPNNAPLYIKARVAAADIGKVGVCQKQVNKCEQGKVLLRISAYPYPEYGVLKGAVRVITADTITSAAASYYEVTIQPERTYLTKGANWYHLQPGMEVTADIIAREETVLTYILRKARLLTDL